jgi:hypothetical protein
MQCGIFNKWTLFEYGKLWPNNVVQFNFMFNTILT